MIRKYKNKYWNYHVEVTESPFAVDIVYENGGRVPLFSLTLAEVNKAESSGIWERMREERGLDKTIIIVETPALRKIVYDLLRKHGYRADLGEKCAAAVRITSKNKCGYNSVAKAYDDSTNTFHTYERLSAATQMGEILSRLTAPAPTPTPTPARIAVRLNDAHTALVEGDSVTVGCQKFPGSAVRELARALPSPAASAPAAWKPVIGAPKRLSCETVLLTRQVHRVRKDMSAAWLGYLIAGEGFTCEPVTGEKPTHYLELPYE